MKKRNPYSLSSLSKVMPYIRYSGCIIEKTSNGFKALRQEFQTLEEAKAFIDASFSNIKNSIK
jgi:hypothetical protein